MHLRTLTTFLFLLLCSKVSSLAIFSHSRSSTSQNVITEAEIDRLRHSGLSETAIASQLTHTTRLSPSAFAPRSYVQKPQPRRWFSAVRRRASRRVVPSAGYLAFLSATAEARGVDDPRGGGRRYVLGYSTSQGFGEKDTFPVGDAGDDRVVLSSDNSNEAADDDDGEEFVLVPAQEAERERRHRLGAGLKRQRREYL